MSDPLIETFHEISFNFDHFTVILNIEEDRWYAEYMEEEDEVEQDLDFQAIKEGVPQQVLDFTITEEIVKKLEKLAENYKDAPWTQSLEGYNNV